MPMKTIDVPITQARTDLCALLERVESGNLRVCLTRHGRPSALIIPIPSEGRPWRAEKPTDPKLYGDLQSPVLEAWE